MTPKNGQYRRREPIVVGCKGRCLSVSVAGWLAELVGSRLSVANRGGFLLRVSLAHGPIAVGERDDLAIEGPRA